MSVVKRCQEVISSPSAVCKQTFLMHARKRGSYFGDQFCTLRKRNVITGSDLQSSSRQPRVRAERAPSRAGGSPRVGACCCLSLHLPRPVAPSLCTVLRTILFLFLKFEKWLPRCICELINLYGAPTIAHHPQPRRGCKDRAGWRLSGQPLGASGGVRKVA